MADRRRQIKVHFSHYWQLIEPKHAVCLVDHHYIVLGLNFDCDENAIFWNKQGLAVAEQAAFPNPEVENNARLNLGDNLFDLGRLDEAEEQYQKVETIVRSPKPQDRMSIWRYSQRLFHSFGKLCLSRGELDRAKAYADECLELAEISKSQKNIVKGRRLHGRVLAAKGHLEEAEAEMSIALEIAQKVSNPIQLWRTCEALGDLYTLQNRSDDASRFYTSALEITDGMAATWTIPYSGRPLMPRPLSRHLLGNYVPELAA